MKYREPWDTADNADSQMARYPRNREGERARRPPTPPYLPIKLHIIITYLHHVRGTALLLSLNRAYSLFETPTDKQYKGAVCWAAPRT